MVVERFNSMLQQELIELGKKCAKIANFLWQENMINRAEYDEMHKIIEDKFGLTWNHN